MHRLNTADWLVTAAFGVGFFGLLTWVIGYAWSTAGDWARTPEGRHLMTFRGSLVVFMAMGVTNNIWMDYPGRDAVRITVVTFFACTVIDGCRLLLRAQRARLQRRRNGLIELHVRGEVDRSGEGPAADILRP